MRKARLRRAAAVTAAALSFSSPIALAEVVQNGTLRVSFEGKVAPKQLPRGTKAPVAVTLAGNIKTTDGQDPPQLRTITMAINRNGKLDYKGLPRCNFHQIQPASTIEAKASCKKSLVGTGTFKASVALPDQSPFPSNGQILAFNGNLHGKPVVYAHIYGTEPLPTSFVLPFQIKQGGGNYATTLVAELPQVAADWGFVQGVSLTLQRQFSYKGRTHSYLSAGCPAPKGFPGAVFSFARASFGFEDGRTLSSTMTRDCKVRP
ncbi:MAG TPA: hypothetical protein VFX85_13660 [Solirubrobacterales bacterium]|nr:hypothetical protein [Solirubrobacterales bacterium]